MKSSFPKNQEEVEKIFLKEYKSPYELILCKCFDCCAYNPCVHKNLTESEFIDAVDSIKYCDEISHTCPLSGYATGTKDLKKKRIITEDQREAMRQRMIHARKVRLENINKSL